MTEGHKHRTVKVRRGSWLHRVLRAPIYHTWDKQKVDDSPYPYGITTPPVISSEDQYYLSLLSLLHRWFGLTLVSPRPCCVNCGHQGHTDLCPECGWLVPLRHGPRVQRWWWRVRGVKVSEYVWPDCGGRG